MLCLLEDSEKIVYTIYKWRVLTTKQINEIVGLGSRATAYRRMESLIQLGYVKRTNYMLGMPGICTLTKKAQREFKVGSINQINLVSLRHDLLVVNLVIKLVERDNISFDDVTSEKELMSMEYRKSNKKLLAKKHYPDFVYKSCDGQKIAVEVELSKKPLKTLEKNIANNFRNYDRQVWFVRKSKKGILNNLEKIKKKYPLKIEFLEDLGL